MAKYTFTRTRDDLADERLNEQLRGNRFENLLFYTVTDEQKKIVGHIRGALTCGGEIELADEDEVAEVWDDVDQMTNDIWALEILQHDTVRDIFVLIGPVMLNPAYKADLENILMQLVAELEEDHAFERGVIYALDDGAEGADGDGCEAIAGDQLPGFEAPEDDAYAACLRRYFDN